MNLGAYPAVSVPEQSAFAAGGRLTLVQNTPVMSSDQASKTVIYYTPDEYGAFPVIKNGVIRPVHFTDDLKLTMTSAFTGSGIFDLFGVERGGRGVLVAGTAWATATAGSCARGTTPGQTELTRAAGMKVNRWGMPGISAENSTYIEPLEGRYLGSVYVDTSAGQTSCHVSHGQSRKHGLFNADNRKNILLKAGDSTATWDYTTAAWRPARNDSANSLTIFSGLAEENYDLQTRANVSLVAESSALVLGARSGVGFNDISGQSGYYSACTFSVSGTVTGYQYNTGLSSNYIAPPSLGINVVTMVEFGSVVNQCRFFGGETNNLLTARWRG